MPLNKFGQSIDNSNYNSILQKVQFSSGVGLKHTQTGDIDVENLKISNVKEPTLDTDATNKKYVDTSIKELYATNKKYVDTSIKELSTTVLETITKISEKLTKSINNCYKIIEQNTKNIEHLENQVKTLTIKVAEDIKSLDTTISNKIDETSTALQLLRNNHFQQLQEHEKSINNLVLELKTFKTKTLQDFQTQKNQEKNINAEIDSIKKQIKNNDLTNVDHIMK